MKTTIISEERWCIQVFRCPTGYFFPKNVYSESYHMRVNWCNVVIRWNRRDEFGTSEWETFFENRNISFLHLQHFVHVFLT